MYIIIQLILKCNYKLILNMKCNLINNENITYDHHQSKIQVWLLQVVWYVVCCTVNIYKSFYYDITYIKLTYINL